MEKEIFYEKTRKFFEEGLLTEIYSDDKIIIMNAYDRFYFCCPLKLIKNEKSDVICCPIFARNITQFISNPNIFYFALDSMSKEEFKDSIVELNDRNYNIMIQDRHRMQGQLPTKNIDKELEERIKKEYGPKTM